MLKSISNCKHARTLADSAARAASSVVKTGVLRRGRVSDAVLDERLSVCADCPGGHATFRSDGTVKTCGPMLEGLKGASAGEAKPCGCLLKAKARDAAEDCPFGYWPKIDLTVGGRSIDEPGNPPLILPNRDLVVPGRHAAKRGRCRPRVSGAAGPVSGGGISRRRFIGRSAAVVAAGAFTARAYGSEEKYIPVEACESGSGTHVACSEVEGKYPGDVFRGDDDNCYELTDGTPSDSYSVLVGVVEWMDDCESCGAMSDAPCTDCDPEGLGSDPEDAVISGHYDDDGDTGYCSDGDGVLPFYGFISTQSAENGTWCAWEWFEYSIGDYVVLYYCSSGTVTFSFQGTCPNIVAIAGEWVVAHRIASTGADHVWVEKATGIFCNPSSGKVSGSHTFSGSYCTTGGGGEGVCNGIPTVTIPS